MTEYSIKIVKVHYLLTNIEDIDGMKLFNWYNKETFYMIRTHFLHQEDLKE